MKWSELRVGDELVDLEPVGTRVIRGIGPGLDGLYYCWDSGSAFVHESCELGDTTIVRRGGRQIHPIGPTWRELNRGDRIGRSGRLEYEIVRHAFESADRNWRITWRAYQAGCSPWDAIISDGPDAPISDSGWRRTHKAGSVDHVGESLREIAERTREAASRISCISHTRDAVRYAISGGDPYALHRMVNEDLGIEPRGRPPRFPEPPKLTLFVQLQHPDADDL